MFSYTVTYSWIITVVQYSITVERTKLVSFGVRLTIDISITHTSQLLISLVMCVQFNNTSNIFLSSLLAVKTLQLNVLVIVRHCRREGGGKC